VYIKASDRTPEVKFDHHLGEVFFSGESYPENAFNFYKPIIAEFKELCQAGKPLVLKFELVYINSSSLGMLRNIFNEIDLYAQQGLSVTVLWQFYKDDDGMREFGEDLQDLFPAIAFKLLGIEV
jgi:hypothetical protein